MRTEFLSIKITRRYLVAEFTIRGQVVAHRHRVRIPWRALNEQYEDVINALEHEANAELRRQAQPLYLPLEAWE